MTKLVGLLMILSVFTMVLISGCTQTPGQTLGQTSPAGGAVCGNGALEGSEQCESDSDCGTGEICMDCACESIPTPPALPE